MTQRTAGRAEAIPAGAVDPLVSPRAEESDQLRDLLARIDALVETKTDGVLRGPDGSEVPIPASAMEALRLVAIAMAQGKAVTVAPHDKELTTQEAADILGVSRPHLVKLLDRGDLPHHRTSNDAGAHRRVLLRDVLAYRDARRDRRRGLLRELTQASQDAQGGYF